MRAGQGKWRRTVVKCRAGPGCGAVAGRALLRESGLGVVRICRPVVIREMTGNAGCRETCINVVPVAGGAGRARSRGTA